MGQEQLKLAPAARAAVAALGAEFLTRFLETEVARHPDNVDALAELGHLYTRQGRIDRGLEVDRQLVRLVPANPTVHYNLACSLAMSARADEAFAALEAAIELGYADADFMRGDEDLRPLRGDARFEALLKKLESDVAR